MEKKNLVKILILFLAVVVLGLVTFLMPVKRVTKQKAALGSGAITLQPPQQSFSVNEEKPISIYLSNTSGKKISFVSLKLSYNKDILRIIGFTPNSQAFDTNLTDSTMLGESSGTAVLQTANKGTNLPADDPILVGTMTIKGINAGNSSITVNEAETQIAGENLTVDDFVFTLSGSAGGTYTIASGSGPTTTPFPSVTPNPTVTPIVPPGTPVLNFKVKFQGVTQKRADQKVKLTVIKGDLSKPFSNINVVADDQGTYSGSVALIDVPAGEGYKIFIKGPKHLSKKFCVDAPTVRCTGEGSIGLVAGDNDYDFSTQVLEAGDLPDPNNNLLQDGIVNAVDYSILKARFTDPENSDNLAIADIDLNGIVNTGDWNLMRITLETKYEEDY